MNSTNIILCILYTFYKKIKSSKKREVIKLVKGLENMPCEEAAERAGSV